MDENEPKSGRDLAEMYANACHKVLKQLEPVTNLMGAKLTLLTRFPDREGAVMMLSNEKEEDYDRLLEDFAKSMKDPSATTMEMP